jgi:hypothetical protein
VRFVSEVGSNVACAVPPLADRNYHSLEGPKPLTTPWRMIVLNVITLFTTYCPVVWPVLAQGGRTSGSHRGTNNKGRQPNAD